MAKTLSYFSFGSDTPLRESTAYFFGFAVDWDRENDWLPVLAVFCGKHMLVVGPHFVDKDDLK